MAHHVVYHVHTAPEEMFENSHVNDQKISTQQTQNYYD